MKRLTDAEVIKLYIEFRSDPISMSWKDVVFCSENSISVSRLQQILANNSDIIRNIEGREVTQKELSRNFGLLLRAAFKQALDGGVPIKSMEGILNAVVSGLKMRQLEAGNPTEILKITDDELANKSEKEKDELLLGFIRGVNPN